jgi:hypothetical protein
LVEALRADLCVPVPLSLDVLLGKYPSAGSHLDSRLSEGFHTTCLRLTGTFLLAVNKHLHL